jgi:hypothetical protein
VAAERMRGAAWVRLRPTFGVWAASLAVSLVGVPVKNNEKAREDSLRGGSIGAIMASATQATVENAG